MKKNNVVKGKMNKIANHANMEKKTRICLLGVGIASSRGGGGGVVLTIWFLYQAPSKKERS